jgi:predicted secreted protein
MKDGETINLKVGQTKYFKFHENPSTGYQMIEDESVDGGLFSTETRYEPSTTL